MYMMNVVTLIDSGGANFVELDFGYCESLGSSPIMIKHDKVTNAMHSTT